MELASWLLEHVRARMVEAQEQTGHMYNLEATPAESATYRFARLDIARFGDQSGAPRGAGGDGIRHAGTADHPYYTNSSQLPVGYTDDPFEAMSLQEPLQQLYTGGTVLHLYLGEAVASASVCKNLVRRSLEQFRLPYLTVTPTFSICPAHGYVSGDHPLCPRCGRDCEVWTRVMGYFRPVSSFNIGKQGEAAERVYFDATRAAADTAQPVLAPQ